MAATSGSRRVVIVGGGFDDALLPSGAYAGKGEPDRPANTAVKHIQT